MIHLSLSPNTEKDDVILSLQKLFSGGFSNSRCQLQLRQKLSSLFPAAKEIFLLNSGRSALMIGLQALELPPGSRVFLQAFTCSAVPNSIVWNKLTPEYVDIKKEDYNLNPDLLPKKPLAKALILQHTFGQAADLKPLLNYCRKNELYLIEDCAHSLGASYQGKPLGTSGDLAVLSFGRDKVISSVFGGALIVNNPKLLKPIKKIFQSLSYPSIFWTIQQLLHPSITYLARLSYSFYLGKILLLLSQKTGIVSKAIYPEECYHRVPTIFPHRLPEPLACLAKHQLAKLKRFNQHRHQLAAYYHRFLDNPLINKPVFNPEGIYLRYTVLLDRPEDLKLYLRKHGLVIEKNHWYTKPITPSLNSSLASYRTGICPVAEEVCKQCLNLPTHPLMTLNDAQKLVKIINRWRP